MKKNKHSLVILLMIIFLIIYIGSLVYFRVSSKPIWSRQVMDLILSNGFFIVALLMYFKNKYASKDQKTYSKTNMITTILIGIGLLIVNFLEL